MGFLSNLFSSGPSVRELSDWLLNMNDKFTELGAAYQKGDNPLCPYNEHDRLVGFTLIHTTRTAHSILYREPSIAPHIGPVYGELRAWYECLWTNYLRGKYPSEDDHKKIAQLYATYELRLSSMMDSLFSQSSRIEKALGSAFDSSFRETVLHPAFAQYVLHQLKYEDECMDSAMENKLSALSSAIAKKAKLKDVTQRAVIFGCLVPAVSKSLNMELLTKFDLSNISVLPEELFE